MGNCLKATRGDQQSLLRENTTSLERVESSELPPPPYQIDGANANATGNQSTNSGVDNLSEEQQIRLAQRLGLIQHLPSGTFDGTKKRRECVICMMDFSVGDPIRFLPCLHIYHKECIDDWLLRSFTCPTCMEPVDAALISTFYTSE